MSQNNETVTTLAKEFATFIEKRQKGEIDECDQNRRNQLPVSNSEDDSGTALFALGSEYSVNPAAELAKIRKQKRAKRQRRSLRVSSHAPIVRDANGIPIRFGDTSTASVISLSLTKRTSSDSKNA